MSAVQATSTSVESAHVLHWYDPNNDDLAAAVAKFLRDGLAADGTALVVAEPAHQADILAALRGRGIDTAARIERGTLRTVPARALLATFMVDGYPSWECFDESVGSLVRETFAASGGGGLRVFGEMVGVLWQGRQFPAAIRLEQLWNRLRRSVPCDVYCAYPIDIFGRQFDAGIIEGLLCAHSTVAPVDSTDRLERAVVRAMKSILGADVQVIGPPEGAPHRAARATLTRGESTILWLRHQLPDKADEILTLASRYYYGSRAGNALSPVTRACAAGAEPR